MPVEARRRPGRPALVDRTRVADLALTRFEKRGFERVTMEELARLARLSRRTLFRAFPSKADLVWHGLDELVDAVEARLRRAPKRLSTRRLHQLLFISSLRWLEEPEAAARAKRHLRVIGKAPELLNHQTVHRLTTVVRRAFERTQPPARAALASRSVVAVGFSAALWWASQDDGQSLLQVTSTAFELVADASRPTPIHR